MAFEHVLLHGLHLSIKMSLDLNPLLQVQLHMFQQNKHREIQKKFGQQQVQL